jgi:hypothetical protein
MPDLPEISMGRDERAVVQEGYNQHIKGIKLGQYCELKRNTLKAYTGMT